MIEIIRLEETDNPIFQQICQWNYHWWGVRDGKTMEEVCYNLAHSLQHQRLPQTFVALWNGEPAGMYQLAIFDDLDSRPDLYPWMINVYVAEAYRGKGICRAMMETVPEYAKQANLSELYLYTKHNGLYEKFGWEFVEEVPTFRADSPVERLYRLKIQ